MLLRRGALRAATLCLATGLAAVAGTAAAPGAAHADPIYCGPSKFIDKIEVADWGNGRFQIVVTPNGEARNYAAWALDQRAAVVDEWHAIQACVRGLYGGLADSIWQQLDCHQRMSWAWDPRRRDWLTGPTYDLESWRPPLSGANLVSELRTDCLNKLGVDENSRVVDPHRPDDGETDLQNAWADIA
ncbi:hypothetical protein [Actinoplanes subtropicus]|uniref:hypothetical protein n=1 Tax=Actinoplanes subtropicus TaxID=543632 RepID=UPI00068F0513|nr:hypothetical protein [Actinoplanes subtropicus]